ncbi:MAG: adenylosuccinate lyase [Acidimicrobiia bacterium]|nr:adenylosuccinate lyase [Acidimicrobiia bacterium]
MIERYSLSPMSLLFTDQARLALWLEVEVLAVEAWASLGVVAEEDAKAVRERAPAVTPELVAAVHEREQVTDHDLAAFVDVVQAAIGGPAAAWVHYGLTSSDVVDTALGATLTRAADLLVDASEALVAALKAQALAHRHTAMVGRTHGMHAEPTTFGHKLALWCLQADRDRARLQAARDAVAVGKVSGAVGTYSNIDPVVEQQVCAGLGLRPVPASQVVARDRHAEYLWACASVGASIEQFATEIRHLARTEVGEVEEPFGAGQKGSSAMPHKRNPILAERLAGLARVLRGNLSAGLEDVALWHERDISHSSVERVILPDSSLLAYYLLVKMRGIVEGMKVHPERMLENLDRSYGLVFSQPVLLALVDAGMGRDDAYRVVQEAARTAWEQRRPLREVLEQDDRVPVPAAALDEAFSLDHALRNVGLVFDALEDRGE